MNARHSSRVRVLGLLFGVSACTAVEHTPEVCAEIDAHIPTVAHVSWVMEDPVLARVHVLDENGDRIQSTSWTDEAAQDIQVHVLGLPHGTTVRLEPEIRRDDAQTQVISPVELDVPHLPIGFPEITAESFGEHSDGLVLTHTLSIEQSMVLILDREGNPVWYTIPESSDRILSVSRSLDGRSIWFAQHPTDYVDIEGEVYHVALDGSFYEHLVLERIHSGIAELPDGGFGFLRKFDGPYQNGRLIWDEIWERDADGEMHQIFSLFDHFEPEALCPHWEMALTGSEEKTPYFDWTHANSLVLSEDGSAWYLMVRHFDALLKIDRQTGELLWTLGGPYTDFERDSDAASLSHPHFSQLIDGGVLVFDNGSHRDPPSSRLVELFIDEEQMKVQAGDEVRAPEGQNIPELGDAIRNSDGNLMGSWTSLGSIEEYDEDVQTLWSLNFELGIYSGRITWMDSLEP